MKKPKKKIDGTMNIIPFYYGTLKIWELVKPKRKRGDIETYRTK